jgi:small nuclear ribonucleoprotein (snRNP)-like protein
MNIAMEQTEEYSDGQLKARYGDCFIRGNNGLAYDLIELSLYFSSLY